jgi:hypothetical protein
MSLISPLVAEAQSCRASSFSIGTSIFELIPTAGVARAWRCEANGIRISENLRTGRLWEYIATRPSPSGVGTQFLERNCCVRKFVSPATAARAALIEWS